MTYGKMKAFLQENYPKFLMYEAESLFDNIEPDMENTEMPDEDLEEVFLALRPQEED